MVAIRSGGKIDRVIMQYEIGTNASAAILWYGMAIASTAESSADNPVIRDMTITDFGINYLNNSTDQDIDYTMENNGVPVVPAVTFTVPFGVGAGYHSVTMLTPVVAGDLPLMTSDPNAGTGTAATRGGGYAAQIP